MRQFGELRRVFVDFTAPPFGKVVAPHFGAMLYGDPFLFVELWQLLWTRTRVEARIRTASHVSIARCFQAHPRISI